MQNGDSFEAEITQVWTPTGGRPLALAVYPTDAFPQSEYVFILGTMGAPRGDVKVGDRGTMTWRTSPSSALWFWEPKRSLAEDFKTSRVTARHHRGGRRS